MDKKTKNSETDDSFFQEEDDRSNEGVEKALDALTIILIWISDAKTFSGRGLRATVLLYLARNDLLGGMTLEEIGEAAGCSKQYVHKLLIELKELLGIS